MSEDVHSPSSSSPTATKTAGLQRVVRGLSAYWAGHGCALLPPCNLEISDAFLHPKTFFGLLGPQPWRGVTAQPVSRPQDGRRGLHPFRTSIHLQLQVALEPSQPREVREQVIECLGALGLDFRRHHLRLDSMDWWHEAVGARGRGWRLSVDGIGIGRITFLERLADLPLGEGSQPVDVTLGVEHLAMVLSGVDSVFRLPWQGDGDGALRYDQLRRTDEKEQSRYVEEVADVGHLRRHLDGLEEESARCLEAELIRPAYERAVDRLALLDVLESRGDLSESERHRRIGSIRQLIGRLGELYLARAGVKRSGTERSGTERSGTERSGTESPETKSAVPSVATVETKDSKIGRKPAETKTRQTKTPPSKKAPSKTARSEADESATKRASGGSTKKPAKKTPGGKTPKRRSPTSRTAKDDAESGDG